MTSPSEGLPAEGSPAPVVVRRRPGRRHVASVALLLVAAGASLVEFTASAFRSSTQSAPTFGTGSVKISDSIAGTTALTGFTNLKPGDVAESCVTVSHTGTAPAQVKLYRGAVSGTGGPYLNLTVTRGTLPAPTGTTPSCSGFTPAAGAQVYTGDYDALPTAYGTGTVLSDAVLPWAGGESRAYKFTVTLDNDLAAAGRSFATTLTWEARSL
ncbi:hypothetical protein NUM3379_41800 [Kineococcus sp. NUM-3379]